MNQNPNNIFYENIETNTIKNENYRKVVYTGKMQFVYMSLKPKDSIKLETHEEHDQFFRIEAGKGQAIINGQTYELDEKLFDLLKDKKYLYEQPNKLRHPLIFYFGHTASFYINKLILANIIK